MNPKESSIGRKIGKNLGKTAFGVSLLGGLAAVMTACATDKGATIPTLPEPTPISAPTVGAIVSENRTTMEKATREEEIITIRDMLKGHNVAPALQDSIDSFLSALPTSQSEYRSVIKKYISHDDRKVEYVIHYNNYNVPIKTIFLSRGQSQLSGGKSTVESLIIVRYGEPSALMGLSKVEAELRQQLFDTFENMKKPHTEFMGTTNMFPAHVDAYTGYGASELDPEKFSISAIADDGIVQQVQWYYSKPQ